MKQSKEELFDEYYNRLVELSDLLREWYIVDKIKPYGVFVYDKAPLAESLNLFDISADKLYLYYPEYYTESCIPEKAKPIIKAIQEQLKYGKKIGMYI